MRSCLSLLLVLSCILSHAQKETAHWFLSGSRVTVDPSGISNTTPAGTGALYPSAGGTSVADAAGNLLFATDGKTIVDKNLAVMPALVNVNLGGSTKVLAVQVPGSTRYYVFYAKANPSAINSNNNKWTLKYAVVDLSRNGGLGDVTTYNQVIDTALSPGFTLAEGTGAGQLWLVTHRASTRSFLCYPITGAGLSTTPVTSTAGSVTTTIDYIFRDLKASNNGKMLAGIAYRDYTNFFAETYQFLEVFNFDAPTGTVTERVRTRRQMGYFSMMQSVEFSPDNRLLYGGYMARIYGLQPCGYGSGRVVQYNLCYTDTLDFDKYSTLVADAFAWCAPSASWGRIQLGADKRIYMPYSGTTVSRINNPNRIGSYSNYVFNAHQVLTTNSSNIATPTFHHKVLEKAVKNNIVYNGGCYPAPLTFSVTNDTITHITWNFGDAGSASNTLSAATAGHVFSQPGLYTVTAQLYSSSGTPIETITELVEIKDPQQRLLYKYPTDTTVCQGAKLRLGQQVVNGIFHWSKTSDWDGHVYSLQTSDSINIDTYSPGTATWYVEMRQNDCDGCVLRDSIRVTVLPVPYIDLGYNRNLCTGDSLQLQVNNPAADYVWSTGDTTKSVWVRGGGLVWVQGEFNHNGCPQRDSIVITSIPGVHFALPNDTTLCSNQTLLLSPGIGNASYLWQSGSTQASYAVTGPGTYWVRVRASNGCQRSDTVNVSYVNASQVFLGNDTTLCAGDSVVLVPAVANARYLWSTGDTTASLTVRQSGPVWVRVANGTCTVTDTIMITFNSPPVVWLGADTVLCDGQRLVLRSGVSGGSRLWSDGTAADTVAVWGPGAWWLRVSKGGCVVSDTVLVRYKPLPPVALGADTALCAGQALTLTAGDPSIRGYLWSDGSTGPLYTVRAAGTYWVRVQGVNGCNNADSIAVRYTPLPSFSLGGDTVLCEGVVLQYAFNLSNAGYVWSTGSRSGGYAVSQPGLYWLQVTQDGCSRRDSITVQYKPLPVVQLGRDTVVCEGTRVVLSAYNNGASYTWTTGSHAPSITVGQPGTYGVQVDLDGCGATGSLQLGYEPLPRVDLGRDTALCNGQSFVLNPQIRNGSLLWSNGTTTPTLTVQGPGVYALQVTTRCGTASDALTVVNGVCQLYMPNAFTPNNDGRNDVFRVKYPQFIKTFTMTVYNRWGQPVFSTQNAYEGWNGRYKGLDQPAGAYIWTITLSDLDGATHSYTGSVLLLR